MTPTDPEAIDRAESLLFPNQNSDGFSRAAARMWAFDVMSHAAPTLDIATLRAFVDELRQQRAS